MERDVVLNKYQVKFQMELQGYMLINLRETLMYKSCSGPQHSKVLPEVWGFGKVFI